MPDELRDQLGELRGELARVRSTVTRTGDDVEVVRARVDDLLVAVSTLAQLEDRRHEHEHALREERLEELRATAAERAAREAERLEARRWWRVSVLERIALPALSAALAFAVARLDRCSGEAILDEVRSLSTETTAHDDADPTSPAP